MRRSSVKSLAAAVGLGAAGAFLSAVARAVDLPWDVAKQQDVTAVRDQSRSAFEPDGIRVGNYLIFPEVGFRTALTKDSLSTPTHPGRDIRYEMITGLEVRSQLPRHLLDIKAEGRAITHQDQQDLTYIDGTIRIVGRIDIDHANSLFGKIKTELHHDENVDADRPKGINKPTPLLTIHSEGGYQYRNGRIDVAVGARYTRFDYQTAEANDGTLVNQDAQDFWSLEPFIALGLRLSPGYRVFTEVSGRYLQNRGDALIDRDAEGIQAAAGVELELSPLVRLTMKGGYLQQNYLQSNLIDIATPVYEARLDWYVSPLVSISFGTMRDAYPTTYGEASGRLVTAYNAKADYEMWRNLILTTEAAYKTVEFVGDSRRDNIWSGK